MGVWAVRISTVTVALTEAWRHHILGLITILVVAFLWELLADDFSREARHQAELDRLWDDDTDLSRSA